MVIAGLWINVIGIVLVLLFAATVNRRRNRRERSVFMINVLFACTVVALITVLIWGTFALRPMPTAQIEKSGVLKASRSAKSAAGD